MPIQRQACDPPELIYTVFSGRVTDDDLLSYYGQLLAQPPEIWREIVDGTQVTEIALTAGGLQRLAGLVQRHIHRLKVERVAMMAHSDCTYGLFRMWELQRAEMGYEVRVFRQLDAAIAWMR